MFHETIDAHLDAKTDIGRTDKSALVASRLLQGNEHKKIHASILDTCKELSEYFETEMNSFPNLLSKCIINIQRLNFFMENILLFYI